MGAFLILHRDSAIEESKVLLVFEKLGFRYPPERFDCGLWSVYNFPKQNVKQLQVELAEDESLHVVGTFIRKNCSRESSLRKTLVDLSAGELESRDCLGTFALIHRRHERLHIFTDASGIQNIFIDDSSHVISSSFLAVQLLLSHTRVRKSAALEVLLTGSLIGPDTLLSEVKRFEGPMITLDGLVIEKLHNVEMGGFFKGSFDEAVDFQNSVLDDYMHWTQQFADEQGVDSGLTSGHDSRLILALLRDHWKWFQVHSHSRKSGSLELDVARELARVADLQLVEERSTHYTDLDQRELVARLHDSYLFADGSIRMHAYWLDAYNSFEYRSRVVRDKNLGISGIGGEQYRNTEHLVLPRRNFRNWVKYELLLLNCGDVFQETNTMERLVEIIAEKVSKKLGGQEQGFVDRLFVKRYYNEVFIPARLGARNNNENKLSFFLSPFTEDQVSKQAYKIVPYLGPSLGFQQEMIKRRSPVLAKVRSDYGYDFYSGEPFLSKALGFLKGVLPYSVLLRKNSSRFSDSIPHWDYLKSLEIIKTLIANVEELDLGVNLEMVARRPSLMPLIVDLGYFIERLKNRELIS